MICCYHTFAFYKSGINVADKEACEKGWLQILRINLKGESLPTRSRAANSCVLTKSGYGPSMVVKRMMKDCTLASVMAGATIIGIDSLWKCDTRSG